MKRSIRYLAITIRRFPTKIRRFLENNASECHETVTIGFAAMVYIPSDKKRRLKVSGVAHVWADVQYFDQRKGASPNQATQRQRPERSDESEERSVRRGGPIRAAYSGVGKRRFQKRDRGKNGLIVT